MVEKWKKEINFQSNHNYKNLLEDEELTIKLMGKYKEASDFVSV
jgi:hypothetical protein